MPNIQLILPMAGESRRFFEAGYPAAKPFFPIGDRLMIDRVLEQFPPNWDRIFVLNTKMEKHSTQALSYLRNKNALKWIEPNLHGPLKSAEAALQAIDSSRPVFLSYCDYRMVWNPEDFEKFIETSNCDIAVVTYRGFHPHYCTPNSYCYVRTAADDGLPAPANAITKIREKSSFTEDRESEHASTGGYYFKTGALLQEGLRLQRALDLNWKGEYFTSFAIQALMESQKLNIQAYEIPYFFQWGTPEDVKVFEYWEKLFKLHKLDTPVNQLSQEIEKIAPNYNKKIDQQRQYFAKAFAND